MRHDLITAVFAAAEEDDLIRLLAKVEALRDFLATEDGANLLTAHRRASNIVRIEEKRDGRSYAGQPDGQRLQAKEEQALFFRLMTVGGDIASALEREEFTDAMVALARLRQPVDAFFDRVTVNAEDPVLRENRLYLLDQIRSALGAIADFSLIEDTASRGQRSAGGVMGKWVYGFGAGAAEGGAEMRDLLGGKGANLAEMSRLGLPVPPGFTISTEVCSHYYAARARYPEGLRERGRGGARAGRGELGAPARRSRERRCWSRCARARRSRCPA